MISSRKLDDLEPSTRLRANQLLAACEREGIDLLVTCTYRDFEAQAALYRQGRTDPGRIVTNANAGRSWHNWRRAFDVVPLRGGKPVWGTSGDDLKLWQRVGELGEIVGLEWAGRWRRFREAPHFQFTGGITLDAMMAAHPNGL